jgi:DNA modification methylase
VAERVGALEYSAFLKSKSARVDSVGFDVPTSKLNQRLFDFQKAVVRWGIRRGRAIFGCDTGLGKSIMAMEWGRQVGGRCLILAPLAVALQFVEEGKKHDYDIPYVRTPADLPIEGLAVTNYERFGAFDGVQLKALVTDECSILASFDGRTRTHIIDRAQDIPFRLGCSATPAPNDYIELGNHAAYLGIMNWQEMAATYFVHEQMSKVGVRGEGSQSWRLKGHAEDAFWRWVVSWMVFVKRPSDIGFDDERFRLPKLTIEDHIVEGHYKPEGMLFATKLSGIQDRTKVRRLTLEERVKKAVKLIKSNNEQWIAWCGLNDEAEAIAEALEDSRNLSGDDDPEEKAQAIIDFTKGRFRTLVTKSKIASMGLNLQNCAHQVFVGLGDSYRDYYQGIRRSWRYGQKRPVQIHIVLSQIESEIAANVRRKERDADHMSREMVKRMSELEKQEVHGTKREEVSYERETAKSPSNLWRIERGDCVEVLRTEKSDTVDFSIYSPPFASLYTYTNSRHDMGNCRSEDEFFGHFGFFLPELLRVTKPGRLTACHVSQLTAMASRDGYIGLKDFRGRVIDAFNRAGWIHHGEICIQKNPQAQAIRTKAMGLLFATLKKDSSKLRPALADFIVLFRKPGENEVPVDCDITNEDWIKYAHPIWTDIKETETLSAIEARDEKDERHVCPLQLEVIRRCIRLYSNKGEIVLSPFAGIGSEGHVAMEWGRRFLGIELKGSYFDAAKRNIAAAERAANEGQLFSIENGPSQDEGAA